MSPSRRRQVLSWCLFDFANSSYSAVIAAVIFPVFYVTVVAGNGTGRGDAWWGLAISLSMAFVAITSPFLGGIADYDGRRKRMLMGYTFLCIISVGLMSLLGRDMPLAGFCLVIAANIGMEGGLVFYNSYLPSIAEPGHHGRVSAWGFGVGYLGSILSLAAALPLVGSGHYGATWLMVAVFFAVFSLPAFLFLPQDQDSGIGIAQAAIEGTSRHLTVLREVIGNRELRRFMLSYLMYEDGVNTVIVFSSIFASTTLGFSSRELIFLYLIVQAAALAGAFVMARPTDTRGPKKVVMLSLLLWTAVTVMAYFVTAKEHFFFVAIVAGLGLGTVQAASRSFFTRFIPRGRENEYFGAYALVGKTSAIIGPLVFGYVSAAFGSQRPAILAISLFFFSGLMLISRVDGGGPATKNDEPAGN